MCPGEASCRLEAEWSCIEKRDVRPLASEILQIPGARYVRHLLQAADQTAAKRDRDEHIRRGPTRGARTRREETCCERAKQREDDQQDRVASVAMQQYVCPPVSPADPDLQRIVVGPGVREVYIDRCRCKQEHQSNKRGERQCEMRDTERYRCAGLCSKHGVRSNR